MSLSMPSASGGTGGYEYRMLGSFLPTGISYTHYGFDWGSPQSVISGVLAAGTADSYSWTLYARDSAGTIVQSRFRVTVSAPPPPSAPSPPSPPSAPPADDPRPAAACRRPATTCRRPATTCRRPATTCRRPAAACRRPATTADTCRRPAAACRRPAAACRRPATTCRRPATATATTATEDRRICREWRSVVDDLRCGCRPWS